MGYVLAREKVLPLMSLGEVGVVACMAAESGVVSQVHSMVLLVPCECRCSMSTCVP